MDLYEALYTCRAMRRVRPDPVPLDVQARILDAAIRAPTGGNAQTWHFLLVDDPAIKAQLGPLYRDSMDQLWKTVYAPRIAAAAADPDPPRQRAIRAGQALGSTPRRPLRGGPPLPVRLRPARSVRRVDLPGRLERATGGASRGGGQRAHRRSERLPRARGLRHPRRPPTMDGSWPAACLSDIPWADGTSPPGVRCTRSRRATGGGRRWVSRPRSRCGPPTAPDR